MAFARCSLSKACALAVCVFLNSTNNSCTPQDINCSSAFWDWDSFSNFAFCCWDSCSNCCRNSAANAAFEASTCSSIRSAEARIISVSRSRSANCLRVVERAASDMLQRSSRCDPARIISSNSWSTFSLSSCNRSLNPVISANSFSTLKSFSSRDAVSFSSLSPRRFDTFSSAFLARSLSSSTSACKSCISVTCDGSKPSVRGRIRKAL
mmetsp:Transcript_2136/g.3714  ORF Transcript_2136/g.3714 Transcript_2136/m.3714 type:complete len:209 (+) Transcript_2136:2291-2917(+)